MSSEYIPPACFDSENGEEFNILSWIKIMES